MSNGSKQQEEKRTVKDVDEDVIKVLSNVHEIEVTLSRLKDEAEEMLRKRIRG